MPQQGGGNVPTIFVDANMILGFWSLTAGRVPSELLLPLVSLRSHVLITQQLVDEVSRNKLGVFLRNSGSFSIAPPPQFPDHFVRTKELNQLNSTLKTLRTGGEDAKKQWDKIRADVAKEISSNRDLTTKMLGQLFSSPVRATDEQIKAARDRRERGNPPGKRTDPLGDQISWQQFLDALGGTSSVWIITRDRDFAEEVNNQLLLNPFLQAELTERDVKNISVYDNLATAIKDLNLAGLIRAADMAELDEKKINELEKKEADAHVPQPPYLLWPDAPWRCPKCHNINVETGLTAHPSQYGGWSYWATCRYCGFRFDTGEPYD